MEPLMDLDAWLEPYRQMWHTSLDKLERHLGAPRPRTRTTESAPSTTKSTTTEKRRTS